MLLDGLDDGVQEALIGRTRLGPAQRQGAALPQSREPQQVQERGAALGAVEVVVLGAAIAGHPGQGRSASQGGQASQRSLWGAAGPRSVSYLQTVSRGILEVNVGPDDPNSYFGVAAVKCYRAN